MILDLQPGAAVEAALRLFCQELLLPTIVLSSAPKVTAAVSAMKEGAADFLGTPVDADRLCAAVRGALSSNDAQFVRARRTKAFRERLLLLSRREREVVDAVLEGFGNKEIAARFGVSRRTVETHRSKAMSKLGARTPADLVRVWLNVEALSEGASIP